MHPQVSAIVLAAGSSVRMGSPKQLLPLGPRPVIRHCVDSVIAGGIIDIVVVLGPSGDGIKAAIDGTPARTAVNGDPSSDMAGSVRTGLGSIDIGSTGVLVCLSDHPLVSSGTIAAIISSHREDPDSIIIPCCRGRRGHPTLFPRSTIEEVFFAPTLRDVIAAHDGKLHLVEVGDEGVILDMDTPEDYERIKVRFS